MFNVIEGALVAWCYQALSCPAVHHRVHYLVQGVLRAAQGLQTFRLDVPILSHAYGLLQEFIPVVFDYREHDLRCGGLLLGQEQQGLRVYGVVGGVQAGVLVVFGLRRTCSCPDTADVSVDTALVSVDTSLVS